MLSTRTAIAALTTLAALAAPLVAAIAVLLGRQELRRDGAPAAGAVVVAKLIHALHLGSASAALVVITFLGKLIFGKVGLRGICGLSVRKFHHIRSNRAKKVNIT